MQPTNQMAALAQLKPHPQNYNRHPAEQVKRLAKSLSKFGQVRSVVVWRETLLAGHGVVEAARSLKWESVRADVLPDDYPEELALAYVAADNELAKQGDPDLAQLAAILEQSKAADAELLEAIGYSDAEFEALLEEVGQSHQATSGDTEAEIDRAEELRQKWGVEAGQLWQLGEHRLICGDCTDAAAVARLMGGEKAQVLFTSPPYWVGFEYENEDKWSEVLSFIALFAGVYVSCVNDDGRIIINTGTSQAAHLTGKAAHMKLIVDEWVRAFELYGWLMRYVRFWVKDGGLLHTAPQSDCIDQHTEFIAYFYRPGGKFRGQERTGEPWAGKGYWDDIRGVARSNGHVAAFPVVLPERNLLLFTRDGEIVLEPFSGSGTTIIACENLSRRCRAVEISPAYVAVALERWHVHTGKTPELVSNG